MPLPRGPPCRRPAQQSSGRYRAGGAAILSPRPTARRVRGGMSIRLERNSCKRTSWPLLRFGSGRRSCAPRRRSVLSAERRGRSPTPKVKFDIDDAEAVLNLVDVLTGKRTAGCQFADRDRTRLSPYYFVAVQNCKAALREQRKRPAPKRSAGHPR